MDSRVLEAQSLYWQVHGGANLSSELREATLIRMAQLHEEIAQERLDQDDSLGWSDFYAAVTAWGEADRLQEARSLVHLGIQRAGAFPAIRSEIIHELDEQRRWLDRREADLSNQSGLTLPATGAR
ncbi:MAG: hypothetical protein ACP5XB_24035 [Isosphaeraceae bacterium]